MATSLCRFGPTPIGHQGGMVSQGRLSKACRIDKNLMTESNSNGRIFFLESCLHFYHGSECFRSFRLVLTAPAPFWSWHLKSFCTQNISTCVCVCWDRLFETQGKVMKRAKSAPGPPAQWPSMRPMPPTSFTGYWEMKDSDNSRTLPVDLFCNVLQLATYEKDRETYQTLHPYVVCNVVGLHTISRVVDFRILHTLDRTYWYVEELCIKIQYASALDNFKEI